MHRVVLIGRQSQGNVDLRHAGIDHALPLIPPPQLRLPPPDRPLRVVENPRDHLGHQARSAPHILQLRLHGLRLLQESLPLLLAGRILQVDGPPRVSPPHRVDIVYRLRHIEPRRRLALQSLPVRQPTHLVEGRHLQEQPAKALLHRLLLVA